MNPQKRVRKKKRAVLLEIMMKQQMESKIKITQQVILLVMKNNQEILTVAKTILAKRIQMTELVERILEMKRKLRKARKKVLMNHL